MMTVKEVSNFTGVSVRALHLYDEKGLLKPAQVTAAGYRLYDEESLKRLRLILIFRELGFPLKEIAALLDSPGASAEKVLTEQLAILEAQRDRLDGIIAFARNILMKEGNEMDFSVFDKYDTAQYAEEAKQRWGDTDAYKEAAEKDKARSETEKMSAAEGLMEYFVRFGKLRGSSPASKEAKRLAGELREYITANFYTCTDEIFAGLAEMYVGDERFRKNIDERGGEGTAAFVAAAIGEFLKN